MHQIVPYNFITGQHFSLSGIVSPNFLSHKVKVVYCTVKKQLKLKAFRKTFTENFHYFDQYLLSSNYKQKPNTWKKRYLQCIIFQPPSTVPQSE